MAGGWRSAMRSWLEPNLFIFEEPIDLLGEGVEFRSVLLSIGMRTRPIPAGPRSGHEDDKLAKHRDIALTSGQNV